jgi:glutamine synthetase
MNATTYLPVTVDNIERNLAHDTKVKVAGVDADGILRGKVMAKDKFLASVKDGFGMSSAIFGWDMHDVLYAGGNDLTSGAQGYADLIAIPDLSTFRRLEWENNVPLVLLRFQVNGEDVHADGRSMLASLRDRLASEGKRSCAGGKHI